MVYLESPIFPKYMSYSENGMGTVDSIKTFAELIQ